MHFLKAFFPFSIILYSNLALGFSLSRVSTNPFSIKLSMIFFSLSLFKSDPGVPVVICLRFNQEPILVKYPKTLRLVSPGV